MDHETLHLLRAARTTGLLAALVSDADTAAEAAETAGVTPRAAELTVEALLAEGFLTRIGSGVEPTNRMLGFLAAADLRSVGELPDELDALEALAALPETMADGAPAGEGDVRNRLGARAAREEAAVRAAATAAVRAAPDAREVLVADGAPGQIATEFAARGRDVTVADHPEAVEVARPLLAQSPVEAVAVAAGEALPAGADLVVAVEGTRRRPPEGSEAFAGRLADAVADDGWVVLVERLWDRSAEAVPTAVEAFARDGGGVYREGDYDEWFADAGLSGPEVWPVPGTDWYALVGTPD